MLTLFPGPLILPEKHDDQPVIFNAVRTNARLKFDISPISKRRHVKIEPVVDKGKGKASADTLSYPPIPRFSRLPTPPSNDLPEPTVPQLAASIHKSHAEGESGSAGTCPCCMQAAYRLLNPPPVQVQEYVQEDPANMPPAHESDDTSEASDESPVREGKRAKRSTDDQELLLAQPFKPRSPNTYQPSQPSSLQQVQNQSDVQPDILLNLPPDPAIHYPPPQPLPIPEVDMTHFGRNPRCAEGTLKGIFSIQIDEPRFRSNDFSNDFCPCESEDLCVCVGCADHPENPATIRHVMEGFNFQATDAYYNDPDFVMPDMPEEDDKAPASDNLANPGRGCCVKLKAASNTVVPTHLQTDLAAKFPTLSLHPNRSIAPASSSNAAASSSLMPPQQTQYQSARQVYETAQHIARVRQLCDMALSNTQGPSSGTPSSADAMPFAEYLRRRQSDDPPGLHLAVVKATMKAVSEARAEAKREGKPFSRKLHKQLEKDVAARTYAEWGCVPPGATSQPSQASHASDSTLIEDLLADVPRRQSGPRAEGHSQSLRLLGQSIKKAQTQVQTDEAQTQVSGVGGGSSSNEFYTEPLPVNILNSAVANAQYLKSQGQSSQDDGSMNVQAENIQPPGQSSIASSSANPQAPNIPFTKAIEAELRQTWGVAPQPSIPQYIEEQSMQLPMDFQPQHILTQDQGAASSSMDTDAQYMQMMADLQAQYGSNQDGSGQASSIDFDAQYMQILADHQAQDGSTQDGSGQASSSTNVFSQLEDPQSSTTEPHNTALQGQTDGASNLMDFQTQYMQPQYMQTQGLSNFQPQAQYTPNPLTLGSMYNPNLTAEPQTMTYAQLQAFQQQLRLQQQQVQEMLDQQAFDMPYYPLFANNTLNSTNNKQNFNTFSNTINQQNFNTFDNTNNQQDFNTILNTDNQQDFTMYGAASQETTGFVKPTTQFDTINPNVLQEEQGGNDNSGVAVSQTTTGFNQPTTQFETINPNVLQQEQGGNVADGGAVPQGTAGFLGTINPNVLQQKQGGNDNGGEL